MKGSMRVGLVLLLALAAASGAFAQLDREELEKSRNEEIVFINYDGPEDRNETIEQIRGIGLGLAAAVQQGASGSQGRYYVVHSVSEADGDKLDADVMILGVDVGVDHIRNLRLIIQGYLEGAYSYSAQDAALLAQFITIYNAVYRGSWGYFQGRYKAPLVGILDQDKAGLSTRYDEWPGGTMLVIPLMTGKAGSLSAIDTTSLTEEDVINQMRDDEDKGIEPRQEMVELKERESEQAEESAQVQREAIKEEEKKIAEEKQSIETEKQDIAEQKEAAQKIENPEEKKAAEEEIARREEQVEKREEQVAADEKTVEAEKQEAQKTVEFAEAKSEEAQKERAAIVADQNQQIAQQEAAKPPEDPGILGARYDSATATQGRLVRVKTDGSAELRSSPLATISLRTITQTGGKLIAVAGENAAGGAVRLVEISQDKLEMVSQGEDDIQPQSLIWQKGNDLYAIVVVGGGNYLGRFDTNLKLQARSAEQVHSQASVLFNGDTILTQRNSGALLMLNASTLAAK